MNKWVARLLLVCISCFLVVSAIFAWLPGCNIVIEVIGKGALLGVTGVGILLVVTALINALAWLIKKAGWYE